MVLVPPLSPLGSVRPLRIRGGAPGGPRLHGYVCGQSPHLLGLGFLGGAGGACQAGDTSVSQATNLCFRERAGVGGTCPGPGMARSTSGQPDGWYSTTTFKDWKLQKHAW